jgi:hypothetical protein
MIKEKESGKPLHQWDSDVLLAYWTSNVDVEHNFSTYIDRTRTRCWELCKPLLGGMALHPLPMAYLLACLEDARYPPLYSEDPDRPTKYREKFIECWKRHKGSPFLWPGKRHVERELPKAARRAREFIQKWNMSGHSAFKKPDDIIMFVTLCYRTVQYNAWHDDFTTWLGADYEPPERKHRRAKKKSGRAKDDSGPKPKLTAAPKEEPPARKPIALDVTRFAETFAGDSLFVGLVQDFPGWSRYGEIPMETDEAPEDDEEKAQDEEDRPSQVVNDIDWLCADVKNMNLDRMKVVVEEDERKAGDVEMQN